MIIYLGIEDERAARKLLDAIQRQKVVGVPIPQEDGKFRFRRQPVTVVYRSGIEEDKHEAAR